MHLYLPDYITKSLMSPPHTIPPPHIDLYTPSFGKDQQNLASLSTSETDTIRCGPDLVFTLVLPHSQSLAIPPSLPSQLSSLSTNISNFLAIMILHKPRQRKKISHPYPAFCSLPPRQPIDICPHSSGP